MTKPYVYVSIHEIKNGFTIEVSSESLQSAGEPLNETYFEPTLEKAAIKGRKLLDIWEERHTEEGKTSE